MNAKQSKKARRKRRAARVLTLRVPPPAHLEPVRDVALLTLEDAAALTGTSARTVQRWRAGGIPPGVYLRTLQAAAFGLLPHPAWQEWTLAPDGSLNHWTARSGLHGIRPAHLHDLANAHSTARYLLQENRRLRDLLEQARRPAPARWPPDTAANDGELGPQLPLFACAQ